MKVFTRTVDDIGRPSSIAIPSFQTWRSKDSDSSSFVACAPLSSFVRGVGLELIDLLVLHVSGSEVAVLDSMDWSIPTRVVLVRFDRHVYQKGNLSASASELSLLSPQAAALQVDQTLAQHGFEIMQTELDTAVDECLRDVRTRSVLGPRHTSDNDDAAQAQCPLFRVYENPQFHRQASPARSRLTAFYNFMGRTMCAPSSQPSEDEPVTSTERSHLSRGSSHPQQANTRMDGELADVADPAAPADSCGTDGADCGETSSRTL